MINACRPFIVLFIICMLFTPAAAVESIDEIVGQLQNNYQTVNSYAAKFKQEAKIKAYPITQESSGELFFKKPGKIRWNYQTPEKQEIVSDGKTVWLYTPSLNQVMKTDYSQATQSKVASVFLSGMGNLKKDFDLSLESSTGKSGFIHLVLIPKDGSDTVKSLVLTIDSKSKHITGSKLTDIYGNMTMISFSDFKFNIDLEDSLFDFKPPAGVEITAAPGKP